MAKKLTSRPGKMEVSILMGSIVAGVLLTVEDRAQGALAGIVLALLFWIMFALIVGVANIGFLPRHRRAPAVACVVAPFSAGLTLYLLGGWPGVRKV
jgi:hypothetical protein